ncbi:MAG: TolC family protein [Armatimonadota bacterium]
MIRLIKTVAFALIGMALSLALPGLAAEPAAISQSDTIGQPIVNQSVSVDEAVGIALKNSPTIASRKALLDVAASKVGMAKAMTRLQISTTTFANAGDMPMVFRGPENVQPQSSTITSDKVRLNQSVMAMYPIYTGGRTRGQVNSTRALHEASINDVTTSELDVALSVKESYYKVLLARRFVDTYKSRANEAEERVRIAQVSYDAGRIAKYDLLRNQTELADALQMLTNAQTDGEMALIELRKKLGVSQTSQLTLTQDLSVQPSVPTLEELQVTAIKHRPELAAMRARVNSTQSNIDVAKSAFKPQVYATAMAELSVSKSSDMNSGTEKGYLIGLTAAIPLLDGGLRKSALAEAKAMQLQMQADQREMVLDVSMSVAGAYTQFGAATKNVGLAQAAITQSEEDYRVIRLRYESGKATNVEVLDAYASLVRAQTNYIDALYTQNTAQAALTRAIGQR